MSLLERPVPAPIATQQPSGKSSTTYDWVIFFEPNEDLEKPFTIMRLDLFKDTNFPWGIIEGAMSDEYRVEKHHIDAVDMVDEGPFCVFAKIQHGNFIYF